MAEPIDLEDAIARLARELQGALDVARLGGIETLPRPRFRTALATPAASPSPAPHPSRSPPAPGPSSLSAVPSQVPPVSTAAPPSSTVETPASPPMYVPPAASAPLSIVADDPIAAVLAGPGGRAEKLERLRAEVIGDCRGCKLHRGRNKLVFGVGNPESPLVFVGEGPGADEDRQGIPFVGRAGQLLTRMIEAMGFKRDDVYICNVVKCRPPNNRDPEPDEVEACEGFLQAQLAIVQPRVIVSLGRYAAQTLLRTKTPITKLRGSWHTYEVKGQRVDVMPTYHPSFLLREENDPEKRRKREAWSDLQQVMKVFASTT